MPVREVDVYLVYEDNSEWFVGGFQTQEDAEAWVAVAVAVAP